MEPALKIVILVAIFYNLITTAFVAFSRVVTQEYEKEGEFVLGPFTIFLFYFCYMVGGIFASRLKKVPQKWGLTLASVGAIIIPLSGIQIREIPTWASFAITGFLVIPFGLGSSYLWPVGGSYIHEVATIYNRL